MNGVSFAHPSDRRSLRPIGLVGDRAWLVPRKNGENPFMDGRMDKYIFSIHIYIYTSIYYTFFSGSTEFSLRGCRKVTVSVLFLFSIFRNKFLPIREISTKAKK